MPPLQTDWLAPTMVLLGSAAIGVLLSWATRRSVDANAPSAHAPGLRELVATRDALVDQLRDLQDAGSTHATEQHTAERRSIELQAAAVLRAIEKEARHHALVSSSDPRLLPAKGGVTGFVAGLACAGVVGALLLFVNSTTSQRHTEGRPPAASNTGVPASHPDAASLEALVRANPDDLEARTTLAQTYFVQKNLIGTYEQTEYVLERRPDHPVAMTYAAMVRLAMGAPDDAIRMLDRAIAIAPALLDARVYKAIALASSGRQAEAAQAIRDAQRQLPENGDTLEELLGRIGAQPAPRTAIRSATTGDAGGRISGVIALDPSAARQIRYPAVIFVHVRPAGTSAGAPSAAIRLEVRSFPAAFTLGPEHSMAGGALPSTARVEARLDLDGNATTVERGPRGVLDDVALGSNDLRIVLK